MARPEAKHWCFTLNNPTEADQSNTPPLYDYMVIGNEVGESGTPHLQGYIALKVKARLTALSKWLPRAHFEIMKGTPQQASDYCKKDGNFHEDGTLPHSQTHSATQKRKADYDEAYDLAKQGKFREIDPALAIRHANAFEKIRAWHVPQGTTLSDDTMAIWIWGPPGIGKSRKARTDFPDAYVKQLNKWWDGYHGEDYVLIEDMDPEHGKHMAHHFKVWLDRYPFPAEVKGATVHNIRPKKVIITSNYSIRECFGDYDWEAVERRCEVIGMK